MYAIVDARHLDAEFLGPLDIRELRFVVGSEGCICGRIRFKARTRVDLGLNMVLGLWWQLWTKLR